MGKERPKSPHPRAAVSARLSADEYRALLGRPSPRKPARSGGRKDLKICPKGDVSDLPLEISLPFLPPSVNATYTTVKDNNTGKTKRVLSAKARKARKAIQTFVQGQLSPEEIYELHIDVELPALTKAGKLRKVDLTNRVKFLEDTVSSCLGIDDRQFFRVVLTKLHAEHERTLIRVFPFGHSARDAA